MRNGAKGWLHPYRDAPSSRVRIRWYQVSPSNGVLEYPTCFTWDQWRARDYEDNAYPGIENAYSYDKGEDTNGLHGTGVCGSPEQWFGGCLTTDPVPALDPVTGIPVCCGGGVLRLTGGMEQGGGATAHLAGVLVVAGGEDHGGVGQGGFSSVLVGGHEEGGFASVTASAYFYGGHESGGWSYASASAYLAGGHEEGGSLSASLAMTLAGGAEEGGVSLSGVALPAVGGAEHGGPELPSSWRLNFSGGQEDGGTEPPPVVSGIKIPNCPTVFFSTYPTVTLVNVVNAACFTGTGRLTYNHSTSQWTGAITTGCGGRVLGLFVSYSGSTPAGVTLHWQWSDACSIPQSGGAGGGSSCSTKLFLWNVPVPAACGGTGTGTGQVKIQF